MQNTKQNALSVESITRFVNSDLGDDTWSFVFWLIAMQNDLLKIPTIFDLTDCKEVGGSPTFPPLPERKTGLLFLDSGTYEAAVIGGADKWRRLYDGTTYDPAAAIP